LIVDQIDTLLQKCLEGYEAGLTPEECLSAWPAQRDFLEPLLRQAILARMSLAALPREDFRERLQTRLMFVAGREAKAAFAAAPRAEFREELHEKLMFVAGREARQTFGVSPDPSFVQRTRNRLRFRAGASAQEALRAVPPPRLPFWVNARRRLLEAASAQNRQPAPHYTLALLTRTALSVAVFVLAITLGGVLYLTARPHTPTANAELASIRLETQQVARQAAAGVPIQADDLAELSGRTLALSGKINTDQTLSPLADQLLPLIKQQQEVVNGVKADLPAPPPALQAAQQQLSQAEAQVHISILRADQTTAPATQPTIAAAATIAPVPSATPGLATPVVTTPVPATAALSLLRISPLPGDTSFGLGWFELATDTLRITVPAGWALIGLTPNADGIARFDTGRLRLDGPSGVIVLIDTVNGQMDALVDGQPLSLREKGFGARTLPVTEIVARAAPVARELSHMLETLTLIPVLAPLPAVPLTTPTSTSTAAPGANATATATATALPTPPPATPTP
jgi:hypothetical protein